MLSVAGLNAVTSPDGYPWLAVAKQLGFVDPVATTRKRLAKLSDASVNKVLYDNAKAFYGI